MSDLMMRFEEATNKFNATLNKPFEISTWGRDIQIDGSIDAGTTSTSFINTTRTAQGTTDAQGLPWLGQKATSSPTVGVDSEKTIVPVRTLGRQITLSDEDASKALTAGSNILQQKIDALKEQFQFDTDKYTYLGDTTLGVTSLLNRTDVSVGNVANGAALSPLWTQKDPDEIVQDFNEGITSIESSSGLGGYPNKVLLSPSRWNYLATTRMSTENNITIMQYVLQQNISSLSGVPLSIEKVKWNIAQGVGSTERMFFYNDNFRFVRLPMLPLSPLNIVQELYGVSRSYRYRYGELNIPYIEMMLYRDGI